MAELVACLHHGNVEVLRENERAFRLESRAQTPQSATKIVSVTRGRTSGELCYALSNGAACNVYAQKPGSDEEQRLFHGVEAQLSELDFSPADEALACAVAGEEGTSAIGVLSDDGRGLRTVTEGDVIDRAPRWAPGGRGEIIYSSAGIGRTKTGKAVSRTPFALHRLRFSDNSVEVLMADAQYDYLAVVPVSHDLLYALRRPFDGARQLSPFASFSGIFRSLLTRRARRAPESLKAHELVRVTSEGSRVVARDVFAFDVSTDENLVYSSKGGVFRIAVGETIPESLSPLDDVQELVLYW